AGTFLVLSIVLGVTTYRSVRVRLRRDPFEIFANSQERLRGHTDENSGLDIRALEAHCEEVRLVKERIKAFRTNVLPAEFSAPPQPALSGTAAQEPSCALTRVGKVGR